MQQKHLVKESEASYRLDDSFRQRIVAYIEKCQLEDGGYFFARIQPSSGTDTYFAVKSLALLGVKPHNPEAVVNFFLRQIKQGTLNGITGIFNAVEVVKELGEITDDIREYAQDHIAVHRNKAGGFGATENIYVEVPSELEETYRAVSILKSIGAKFDEQAIASFVSSFLNHNGGYGESGHSTLASTFYATEIHKLLATDIKNLEGTRAYLKRREYHWLVHFIEDLFWLVGGLTNLGEKPNSPGRITEFVLECQRQNGGFARAGIMGIPTLEYTFYAVSILRWIGIL